MDKEKLLTIGFRFKIGEDIYEVFSKKKNKDFTRCVLTSDDPNILDSEISYYSDDKIILKKKEKIKCVIRKNSINNNGRILQLSNVQKKVIFDSDSNKLKKTQLYELTDFRNNKTKLKLEKFEDGTMILHDYLVIDMSKIEPPVKKDIERDVFDEDKKFIIKYKETPR